MHIEKHGLLAAWCLVLGLAMAFLAVPTPSEGGERHAGTVLSVDADRRTVVLDEFGANAVRRTMTVKISPDAALVRSERNEPVIDFDQAFTNTRIDLADVRPGDFVVVELGDRPDLATALVVTLRQGS